MVMEKQPETFSFVEEEVVAMDMHQPYKVEEEAIIQQVVVETNDAASAVVAKFVVVDVQQANAALFVVVALNEFVEVAVEKNKCYDLEEHLRGECQCSHYAVVVSRKRTSVKEVDAYVVVLEVGPQAVLQALLLILYDDNVVDVKVIAAGVELVWVEFGGNVEVVVVVVGEFDYETEFAAAVVYGKQEQIEVVVVLAMTFGAQQMLAD